MVPKLAGNGSGKGASFKGAAAYYLHDKDAQTSERIAWTETVNLATEDAQRAWRIMAATAMDQDRLKDRAGIKATGRKSNKPVWVYSLSWHPDEAGRLTQKDMLAAARETLTVLGADQHQALIVAHNDEPHPHVHVIVNRVSPKDGRMLSDSKAKLKLSQWAQDYEQRRGRVYCEERLLNNEARERGEYIRARAVHHHIHTAYQQTKAAANDNVKPLLRRALAADHAHNASLAQLKAQMHTKHRKAWRDLGRKYRDRKKAAQHEARRQAGKARREVRESYRPDWRRMLFRDTQAIRAYEAREASVAGRLRNTMDALLATWRSDYDRITIIQKSFDIFARRGARIQAIKDRHNAGKEALLKQQHDAEARAVQDIEAATRTRAAVNRQAYLTERAYLIETQKAEIKEMRRHWRDRAAQSAAKRSAGPWPEGLPCPGARLRAGKTDL